MSIGSLKAVPEDLKTSIIRVYSYEDKNIQGTLYNPFYNEETYFANLTQFLLLMDDLMDRMKFPQESLQSRRFDNQKKAPEPVRFEPKQMPKQKKK